MDLAGSALPVAPADAGADGSAGAAAGGATAATAAGAARRALRSPVQSTDTTAAVITNAAPRMRGSGDAGRQVTAPAARPNARPTRVDQRL